MKKHIFGKKLKRDKNERKALFKSLMTELVMHERIQTTKAKAAAIRGAIEKLTTKAKNSKQNASRLIEPYLSKEATQKLIADIAPRFEKRPGGYTRIIKLGNRFSDNAETVLMEWVEKKAQMAVVPSTSENKTKEKEQKALPKEVSVVKEDKKKSVKASKGKTIKEKKEKKTK